ATLLENLILQALRQTLRYDLDAVRLDCVLDVNPLAIQGIQRLITLGGNLGLHLNLERSQEVYYTYIQHCSSIPSLGRALGVVE
ncbi:MAG: hypothetical protein AAF808_14390, partial [Cyanobacteria bacterium P01_D01_bin.2]